MKKACEIFIFAIGIRCKRLNIQCYYLKPIPAPNLHENEFDNCCELQLQVECLKNMIQDMEQNLQSLQPEKRPEKKYKKNISTTRETSATNWQLTLNKNGTMSIHTDITTHTELLRHLESLSNNHFSLSKQAMLNACTAYIHRQKFEKKLRKGLFDAIIKCIEYNENESRFIIRDAVSTFSSNQPLAILMTSLLQVFFSCQFLDRVSFHQQTFWKLFIKDRAEPSPVVYALCAAILTDRCRHIAQLVSYKEMDSLSKLFFEKARDLIENRFDDASLETMMTFVYMATYKANTLYPREASMYLELALRIRHILVQDRYKEPITCEIGEYETLKRQGTAFQYIISVIQYVNNWRGIPVQHKPYYNDTVRNEARKMHATINLIKCDMTPMPDESQSVIQSIIGKRYIDMISAVVHPYYSRVRHGADDDIPLPFILNIEQQLRQIYYQKIPSDYRLPASIFEDGLNDLEFRKRLSECDQCHPTSVKLAATFYQSFVGLYEPFLPAIQKRRMAGKIECDPFELQAQKICYKSSIIVVRLLEYLCTKLGSCNTNLGLLSSVWEMHGRNACLDMTKKELIENGVYEYLSAEEIETSREYMIRCIGVLKQGYLFNGAEKGAWEYFNDFEQKLIKTLYNSPLQTTEYWGPVHGC